MARRNHQRRSPTRAARPASATVVAAPAIGAVAGLGIALVRIAIGYLWFTQSLWKLPPSFGCKSGYTMSTENGGLCDWIAREIESPRFTWYQRILTDVVTPNFVYLGYLVYIGETLAALLLVTGLLTRLGGALGAVQGVNLLIGLWSVPHEWYWTYLLLALINLLLALIAAGRWFGLDHWLYPAAARRAQSGGGFWWRLLAALS